MIAILLATYNGEKYLSEQLDSIINQTFQDFKCYIHDDGSSDNTVNILNDYHELYPDKIIILDGPSSGGSKNNFFYLLENVCAEYYMFCDQDDVWLPQKIQLMHDAMLRIESKKNSTPCMVFSDMVVVDSELRTINNSFASFSNIDPQGHSSFNYLVCQNVVAGCSTLFNKSCRDIGLRYDDLSKIRWHDWWLALVASGAGELFYINESLTLYRQHNDNCVGANNDKGIIKFIQLFCWLITLSHVKETKKRIDVFVSQAQQLKNIELDIENREIVKVMEDFYYMNKFDKVKSFMRYHIYRNKRNLWQLLCL